MVVVCLAFCSPGMRACVRFSYAVRGIPGRGAVQSAVYAGDANQGAFCALAYSLHLV